MHDFHPLSYSGCSRGADMKEGKNLDDAAGVKPVTGDIDLQK